MQIDCAESSNVFLTVPIEEEDEEQEDLDTPELNEEDLELLDVSDHSSTPEKENQVDEFEVLRLARLQTQRSVCAPERDVTEDDTETAEFQTRLRKLSSSRNDIFNPKFNPELYNECFY